MFWSVAPQERTLWFAVWRGLRIPPETVAGSSLHPACQSTPSLRYPSPRQSSRSSHLQQPPADSFSVLPAIVDFRRRQAPGGLLVAQAQPLRACRARYRRLVHDSERVSPLVFQGLGQVADSKPSLRVGPAILRGVCEPYNSTQL